jgi:hypothetical protein
MEKKTQIMACILLNYEDFKSFFVDLEDGYTTFHPSIGGIQFSSI